MPREAASCEMSNMFSKWVAFWGNAISISDRQISTYAKDLTLRYPLYVPFDGNKVRLHFSNFTGTEDVKITSCFVMRESEGNFSNPHQVLFNGSESGKIPPQKEIITDDISIDLKRGDTLTVSIYFADYTEMRAGTLVTGPLSKAFFAYGNFAKEKELPENLSRETNWFYFLNTADIFTEEKNHALICYGDSITAHEWPDWLKLKLEKENVTDISVIRRAVCGTRILRDYECITYQAYGLKGEKRFDYEAQAAGADSIIIQHGINDIIHPVGTEVNKFRPMSDMPASDDLINGVKSLYLKIAKERGYKIYSGTLLPIFGWRTYADFREPVKNEYNEWLRTSSEFDACVDFDKALRDENDTRKFADGFDSGDHLHPSSEGYKKMADTAFEVITKDN